jgi:hypothetical protein
MKMIKMNYLIIIFILFLVIIAGCINNTDNGNKDNINTIRYPKFGDLELTIEMNSKIYYLEEYHSINIITKLRNKSFKTVDIIEYYYSEFVFYFIFNNTVLEATGSSENYWEGDVDYIPLLPGEYILKNINFTSGIITKFTDSNNKITYYTLPKGEFIVYATYGYDGCKIESNKFDFKIV